MNSVLQRFFLVVLAWLAACGFMLPVFGAPDPTVTDHVDPLAKKAVVLRVDGIISPASADFIVRGLKRAAEENAVLAVIELDTPGGLDTSMRAIIKQILSSPVPVATYVGPSGARAASAGTFILYASHIAAMSPASNLGAASPVSIGGSPPPAKGAGNAEDDNKSRQEGKPGSSGGLGGDTMTAKVRNDAAAYIRSLAQLRGRNIEFAEKAVLEATSMSAQEALKAGVIDYIAVNVDDLLQQLDGREIRLDTGNAVTLDTKSLQIVPVEPDWRTQLLGIIANPQVAVVLMMIGIYGLFFEMTNPGMALPGVAGLICLLLGLYAFQVLPVNWAGVALIAAGTVLMIIEVFMPSFGALGAGGLVAFILGGLLLTDTNVPGFDVSIPFLVGTAIVSVILLVLLGAMAARAHKSRVVSGREEMLGLRGEVISIEDGMVYADVRGERWRVESSTALTLHDTVRVVAIDGLKLKVDRIKVTSSPGH